MVCDLHVCTCTDVFVKTVFEPRPFGVRTFWSALTFWPCLRDNGQNKMYLVLCWDHTARFIQDKHNREYSPALSDRNTAAALDMLHKHWRKPAEERRGVVLAEVTKTAAVYVLWETSEKPALLCLDPQADLEEPTAQGLLPAPPGAAVSGWMLFPVLPEAVQVESASSSTGCQDRVPWISLWALIGCHDASCHTSSNILTWMLETCGAPRYKRIWRIIKCLHWLCM